MKQASQFFVLSLMQLALFLSGCTGKFFDNSVKGRVGAAIGKLSLSTSNDSLNLNEGSQASIYLLLSKEAPKDVVVRWQATDPHSRLLLSSGTLTFLQNQTSNQINIQALTNSVLNDSETVELTFSSSDLFNAIHIRVNIVDLTTPAQLSILPSNTFTFPLASLNDLKTQSFVLQNSGSVAATGLTVTSAPSSPYDFFSGSSFPGSGGTCSATLAAGSSCSFVLSFSSGAAGTFNQPIGLSYNNGVSTQNLTLSLTAQATSVLSTLSNAPAALSNVTSFAITVGGSGITHYQYAFGASPLNCSSATYSSTLPVSTAVSGVGLSDGTYSVCVIGYDGVAWQDKSLATTAQWAVDTAPPGSPTFSINGSSSSYTQSTSASAAYYALDVTDYYLTTQAGCATGGTWQTYALTSSLTLTSNILNTYYVKYRDGANNETACLSASVTHDALSPNAPSGLSLGSSPIDLTSTPTLSFAVATDNGPAGVSKYQVRLLRSSDSSVIVNWQDFSSGNKLTGLSLVEGTSYLFELRTVDQANNNSIATNSSTFVSSALITATLSGTMSSPSSLTLLNVTVAGYAVTEYKYKVGTAASTDCTVSSGYSTSIPVATIISSSVSGLSDGSIRLCVVGGDGSTWQSYASATSHTWTKDTTAPGVTLSTTAPSPTNLASLPIVVSLSEPVSPDLQATDFSVGSATISNFSKVSSQQWTLDLIPSTDVATITLQLPSAKTSDAAGNSNTVSNTLSVSYDRLQPSLTLTTPANGASVTVVNQASYSFSGTCSENGRAVTLAGDVTAALTCSGGSYSTTINLTPAAVGTLNYTVTHNKASGASTTLTRTLTKIANRAPALPSLSSLTGTTGVALTTIDLNDTSTANDTDADGQVITYACVYDQTIDGSVTTSANCSTISGFSFNSTTGVLNWTPSAAGSFEFKISATDGTLTDQKIMSAVISEPPFNGNICAPGANGVSQTVTQTSGTLYDSGGSGGQYSNSENCTFVINSTAIFDISVSSYDMEANYDYLRVFPGTSGGTEIRNFNGTQSVVTNFSVQGPFRFTFTSDSSVVGNGFALTWVAQAPSIGVTIAREASQNDQTTAWPVLFDVTFSQAIDSSTLTASDFVNGGTATGVVWAVSPIAGNVYRLQATSSTSDGTITPELPAGRVTDFSALPNSAQSSTQSVYFGNILATLSGLPDDYDPSTILSVQVGGSTVSQYTYFLADAPFSCSGAGYGGSRTVASIINNLLSSITAPQTKKLCVRGGTSAGGWQSAATATEYSWVQDVELTVTASSNYIDLGEGNSDSAQTITYNLTPQVNYPVTIYYRINGNASLSDTNLTSGSFVIPANASSYALPFTLHGNSTVEGNRLQHVDLYSSDQRFLNFGNNARVTVLIREDDSTSDSFIKISAGNLHACGISALNKLKCWGDNTYGQIGDGTTVSKLIPTLVDSSTSYAWVSAGDNYTCAVTTTGQLKCWGYNVSYQLGDGTTTQRNSPVVVDSGNLYLRVAAGGMGTCAISDTNKLKCWGSGFISGTGVMVTSPGVIDSGTDYSHAEIGTYHACALTSLGKIKCWGSNSTGQLGIGSLTDSYTPTAVDSATNYSQLSVGTNSACAITSANVLKCWGYNFHGQAGDSSGTARTSPQIVDAGISYNMIYAGTDFFCGRTSSMVLRCYGANHRGQFGDGGNSAINAGVNAQNNFTYSTAAAGENFMCANKANGSIDCWGSNDYGQLGRGSREYRIGPTNLVTGETFKGISLTAERACAINSDDRLKCWGKNYAQRLGDGSSIARYTPVQLTPLSQFSSVSLNYAQGCSIEVSGLLRCWGDNTYKQIADWVASDAIYPRSVLKSWRFSKVGVGTSHVCALRTSGQVYCWGRNIYGQAGTGATSATQDTPFEVSAGTLFTQLSVQGDNSCAIDSTGALNCWGYNGFGQLPGVGGSFSATPVTVLPGTNFSRVSIGDGQICAIATGGTLYCWGRNNWGQLGNNTTTSNSTPQLIDSGTSYNEVAAGSLHTCGITSSGAAKCWGRNSGGQLGDGESSLLTNSTTPLTVSGSATYSQITAGSSSTCALTTAGNLQCWGTSNSAEFAFGDDPKSIRPTR